MTYGVVLLPGRPQLVDAPEEVVAVVGEIVNVVCAFDAYPRPKVCACDVLLFFFRSSGRLFYCFLFVFYWFCLFCLFRFVFLFTFLLILSFFYCLFYFICFVQNANY